MQLEVQGMDEHTQQVCDVNAHQHLYVYTRKPNVAVL